MTDDEPIMPPRYPGCILREEFLEPIGMTDDQFADATGVPHAQVRAITHGTCDILVDLALRLSRYFGMSEGFWIGMQADYDRELARDLLRKGRSPRDEGRVDGFTWRDFLVGPRPYGHRPTIGDIIIPP